MVIYNLQDIVSSDLGAIQEDCPPRFIGFCFQINQSLPLFASYCHPYIGGATSRMNDPSSKYNMFHFHTTKEKITIFSYN